MLKHNLQVTKSIMADYRRYYVAGGTYFFTLVTADRFPLFRSSEARDLLGRIMRETRQQLPYSTIAIVLMPDHLHAIWSLPTNDSNYPRRWQTIKARFTGEWLKQGGAERHVSKGYTHQRRRGIWQPRFFEHTICDENDLLHHADYLHYNPVKHGHAQHPKDWPWSSFHRYVTSGDYPEDWGANDQKLNFGNINTNILQ